MTHNILCYSESTGLGLKFAGHPDTKAQPRFHKILSAQLMSLSPTRTGSLNSCIWAFNAIPELLVRGGMLALLQPLGPTSPSTPIFRHLYFNPGPLHQCFKAGRHFGANKERADKD